MSAASASNSCLSRLPSFILPKFGSEIPELAAYGILAYFCEEGSLAILLVALKLLKRPLEAVLPGSW